MLEVEPTGRATIESGRNGKKLSPALLHTHLQGGSTIDIPPIKLPSAGSYRLSAQYLVLRISAQRKHTYEPIDKNAKNY